MGRAAAARRRSRGGELVQALRAAGARLTEGAPALAALAAVGAYPVLACERLPGIPAALASGAALALAGALLFRAHALIPASLTLLGGAYLAFLLLDDRLTDGWSPLVAGGLVLVAELAYPALERRAPSESRRLQLRRAATAPLLAAGAAALGVALLTVSESGAEGTLLLEAVGIAAAIAAIGVLTWLARGQAGS